MAFVPVFGESSISGGPPYVDLKISEFVTVPLSFVCVVLCSCGVVVDVLLTCVCVCWHRMVQVVRTV